MSSHRTRAQGLSDEQVLELQSTVRALHDHAHMSYTAISTRTGVDRASIANFLRGRTRAPAWLPEFCRSVAELASERRADLLEALPAIDEVISILREGEPNSPTQTKRRRLMWEASQAFLDVDEDDAIEVTRQYTNTYLCYRHSSRPNMMVCTVLRINRYDPVAKVTTFLSFYRSLKGEELVTDGIVIRQQRKRLFFIGTTRHSAGIMYMALNEPLSRGRRFDFMSGVAIGVNAATNLVAARVLCIPTHETTSAASILRDKARAGARPTEEVLDEIHGHLGKLSETEREHVIAGLSNRISEDDVLVLKYGV